VIGRLLDLSHISWRTCVADLLANHMMGIPMRPHPEPETPSEAVSAEGAEPTAYANALSAEFVLGGRS